MAVEAVRTAARRLLDEAGRPAAAGRLRQVISRWETGRVFGEKLLPVREAVQKLPSPAAGKGATVAKPKSGRWNAQLLLFGLEQHRGDLMQALLLGQFGNFLPRGAPVDRRRGPTAFR